MANLNQMTEHCDECGEELELGQIGLCDCCQDLDVQAEAGCELATEEDSIENR